MIFFRKHYESDLTKMMRDLLQDQPRIVEEQRQGRALWWDKKLDRDELARGQESNVKQKSYVYQTDG